jgi:hypothetical protein
LAAEEEAAIKAGDTVKEEQAFDEAVKLNGELEGFRAQRMSARTGVPEAELKSLIKLAADDGAAVESLLSRAANDPARVRPLLQAAGGDINNLARLMKDIDAFKPPLKTPPGVVADPRLKPLANDVDLGHLSKRHSSEHFDFNDIKPDNQQWPKGTTPSQIQDKVAEAIDIMKKNGDKFPPNQKRILTLSDGTTVQILRSDADRIVQFFPLDGPGVRFYSRPEMTAIGKLFGFIPP